jgi:hypothetical protein
MSLVKFELKEDHISLLRNMAWNKGDMDPIIGEFDGDYDEEEILSFMVFQTQSLTQKVTRLSLTLTNKLKFLTNSKKSYQQQWISLCNWVLLKLVIIRPSIT